MAKQIVKMSKKAYKKFLRFVVEHAHPNSPHRHWQEVIGFMFGRFGETDEDPEVYVTDVLPMDSGSSVYVKVGDYTPIYPVLIEKLEQETPEFIVGWIHSHPGLSLFLSGTDISTQNTYQLVDSRSVAIVVDPTKIRSDYPGLEAFRLTNGRDYNTIPIEIEEIQDFTNIYQEIVHELPVPLPISPFSSTNIVELDQIKLQLEGPNYWGVEPFQITLRYESYQEGYINIEYIPKIQGGMLKPMRRSIIRHSVYESGIIAIFQAQGITKDNSQLPSALQLRLENLTIINNKGEKIFPGELSLATQLTS
ncbi:MAG: hypothetical protein ACXAC7_00005 [Candidatus Hodarchaeales archaeon]|jgi:proteasome lid subunit RPN8/RPN11